MKFFVSVLLTVWASAALNLMASPGHHGEKAPPKSMAVTVTESIDESGSHALRDKTSAAHDESQHANGAGSPVMDDANYDQVIYVSLLDNMRIEYDQPLNVEHESIVKFVVTNRGSIRHEFAISNAAEQEAHVAMMRKMPNMVHEDASTVSLASGETRTIVWSFDGENQVVFSCNIPGHSEAGMITQVVLSENRDS